MMKYIWLCCLLIGCWIPSFAQEEDAIEQLETKLAKEQDVEKQIGILHTLSSKTAYTDPEQSRKYARESVKLHQNRPKDSLFFESKLSYIRSYAAEGRWDSTEILLHQFLEENPNLKNYRILGIAYNMLGICKMATGQIVEAIPILEQTYEYANVDTNDLSLMIPVCMNLAILYKKLGMIEEALAFRENALTLAIQTGSKKEEGMLLRSMGNMMIEFDPAKSVGYLKKARQIAHETQNIRAEIRAINPMAHYFLEREPDSSVFYARTSYLLADEKEMEAEKIIALYWWAMAEIERENTELAEAKIAEIDLIIADTSLETSFIERFNLLGAKGKLAQKKGKYAEALTHLEECLSLTQANRMFPLEQKVLQDLEKLHAEFGQYKAAYEVQQLWQQIDDSLQSDQSTKQLALMESKYIDAENERSIAVLEAEQTDLEAKNRQSRNIAIGIGLLAIVLLSFIWYSRRQNQLISEQNRQLAHLNHTKDRIFAIIGHDMRKPALAFRGIAEKVNYLIQKGETNRLNRLGEEVEKNALSLNKLIDNLLAWALTQRDVMPYHPESLSVKQLVIEEIELFRAFAEKKNIRLAINIPEQTKVYADSNALRTIVRNLVDNAIKYTPKGGTITLEAEQTQEGTKIQVQDTGVGIPATKLQDIFLLSDAKSERGTAGETGTGLGLHLIKELAELNKGRISVQSQVGQGSQFQLLLPSA